MIAKELELSGRLRRTIDMMRELGFSQADIEAEIERVQKIRVEPTTTKCMRCKTKSTLPDYPLCDDCREVMRGWLKTDIEVTHRRNPAR